MLDVWFFKEVCRDPEHQDVPLYWSRALSSFPCSCVPGCRPTPGEQPGLYRGRHSQKTRTVLLEIVLFHMGML